MMTFQLTANFDQDRTKDGWKLESDSEDTEGEFCPELAEFIVKGEDWGKENKMIHRLKKIGDCCGQRHAEAMLRDQSRIPEDWRKFHLVFPKTLWRYRFPSRRRVSCLFWNQDKWCLRFYWFCDIFFRFSRVVHIKTK